MALTRTISAVVAMGLASAMVLAQADPMLGTWKLNVAKSKTTYKSGTTVIEAAGDAVKVTADLAAADGKTRTVTTTGTDAKGQPVNTVSVYDRQ